MDVEVNCPVVNRYVPVLDDPITVFEIATELKRLKSCKAAGVDGVPPGAKLSSLEWLDVICVLFDVFLGWLSGAVVRC